VVGFEAFNGRKADFLQDEGTDIGREGGREGGLSFSYFAVVGFEAFNGREAD